jgi:hypothetical protein
LKLHPHVDNWGKLTSAPQYVGQTAPTTPTTIVLESDLDTATNSKKIDGKQFLPHKHSGVTAGAQDTGGVS